jgi:hypothetical protein
MLWSSIDSFRRMQKLVATALVEEARLIPTPNGQSNPDMIDHILASGTSLCIRLLEHSGHYRFHDGILCGIMSKMFLVSSRQQRVC